MKTTYYVKLYDINKTLMYVLEFNRPVCKDYFETILDVARINDFKPLRDKKFMDLYGIKSFGEIQFDHSEIYRTSLLVEGDN